MNDITHLRSQFKLINTFEKSYFYIVTLIRREKTFYLLFEKSMVLICKTSSFVTQGCSMPRLVEISLAVLEKKILEENVKGL